MMHLTSAKFVPKASLVSQSGRALRAASDIARDLDAKKALVSSTHLLSNFAPDNQFDIAEMLFNATASVKVLTSQVAMHLDRDWRDKLFKQLDSIHDPEQWEGNDPPVQKASFSSFLKFICKIKPVRRPGLGLGPSGNLVAVWINKSNRLTVEFEPRDRVRWVVTEVEGDESKSLFTGSCAVSRFYSSLGGLRPARWFGNGED